MTQRFDKEAYICHNCKVLVDNVEDLLFVEDSSTRCFCSEGCIDGFFSPFAKKHQLTLHKMREDFRLLDEPCLEFSEDAHVMNQTCVRPDEIWCLENKLGDETYTLISKQDEGEGEFYHIVLCTLFDKAPAYIFLSTATTNKLLLEKFRVGECIEDVEGFLKSKEELEEFGLNEEMLTELEVKKSEVLANLMTNQSPMDIQIESIPLYEPFFAPTLEDPDQIFKFMDDAGDEMFSYIKAHEKDGVSFYYIILMMGVDNKNEGTTALLPVISFPTVDGELCESYRKGEMISGVVAS